MDNHFQYMLYALGIAFLFTKKWESGYQYCMVSLHLFVSVLSLLFFVLMALHAHIRCVVLFVEFGKTTMLT